MQERMEWLIDLSINLRCDWSFSTGEALRRDEGTSILELCDVAKVR
jgi:hypothetical protein